ncbi:MAG: 2-oxo acid dehydrogenase subunit E2 [Deltaproteobacteria bacterium]|nr:2-oxo acid dehydrogenase subunit E2 [Deltaproteobacteria bacterium]
MARDDEPDLTRQAAKGAALRPIRATSLARKLAARTGMSLDQIAGTGPQGRIRKRDVAPAAGPEAGRGGRILPHSPGSDKPRRIEGSAFPAPHVHFFTEVNMRRLLQLREAVGTQFEEKYHLPLLIDDVLIQAVAATIREFPLMNGRIRGEEIHIGSEINIGLTVAGPQGSLAPAIPRADRLGLGEIARFRQDLTGRARTGALSPEETERGTFTISNLAHFEILYFTAAIPPSQSALLTVGQTTEGLILEDGKPAVEKTAVFGLSADHRIIDGAVAASFLRSLREKLQGPEFSFFRL